jgi:hypothetical protein
VCQSLRSLHPLHGKVRAPSSGLPPGNKSGSSQNQRSRIRSCIFRPGSAKVLHSPKLLLRLAQCPLGVLRQARASRSYLPLVGNNTPTPPPHYCARFARAFVKPPLGPGGPAVKRGLLCRVRAGTQGRAHPPHLFNPYGLARSFGNSLACVGRATPHSLRSFVKQGASARPARASFRGVYHAEVASCGGVTEKSKDCCEIGTLKRRCAKRNVSTSPCCGANSGACKIW